MPASDARNSALLARCTASRIDAVSAAASILEAVRRAVSVEFRASLAGMENPYGDGFASDRIVDVLANVTLGQDLLMKKSRN